MTRGRPGITVCLLLLVVATGCVSALSEPPPVAELGAGISWDSRSPGDVADLLGDAAIEFDRRPDVTAVERARELFLEVARADETCIEAFLGAGRATAWLVEHVDDPERRQELAVDGVHIGQWCGRLHPAEPECRYRLALAVGQQARERPSTAEDGLDVMVALLEELVEEAPDLDSAGPDRVLALVLVRAPGWPTGPGDPEYGLEHARNAVARYPEHPPNQLVLGEALLENGQRDAGRRALERGAALAASLEVAGDPEAAEWRAKAVETLADFR